MKPDFARKARCLALAAACASVGPHPVAAGQGLTRLIGYFDAKAQGELPVDAIPYQNLTHIVLTNAVKVDSTGKLHYRLRVRQSDKSAEELIEELARLPTKLVISLRGHPDDVALDELAEVDQLREDFATSMAVLVRDWGAGGLEIEWHSDDPAGGKPLAAPFDAMEQLHFALLCRDVAGTLRAAGGRTLSVATRPGRREFASGLFVHEYIDWLSIGAYSMRSLGDPHHSSAKDMVAALDEWQSRGARPDQLVLSTPLFGRPGAALSTAGDRNEALRRPWRQLLRGGSMRAAGGDPRGDVFLDEDTGKTWWVSGLNTTLAKVAYILDNGHGGIAFRDLHHDTDIEDSSLVRAATEAARNQHGARRRNSPFAGQMSLFQRRLTLSRTKGDDRSRDEF